MVCCILYRLCVGQHSENNIPLIEPSIISTPLSSYTYHTSSIGMKHLTLILTLFFSTLMFASPAYAVWVKVGEMANGTTYYVDFDRIRTNNGYVYWWTTKDYLDSFSATGVKSRETYRQGDCEMFRYKMLSFSYPSSGEQYSPPSRWEYPSPNSVYEKILEQVCEYKENL